MNKCVLILDDDPEILMVCKIILEQRDYIVETRLFCDNILKDCTDVSPDIILMDLWIPVIGGEEAVNLIKRNPATAHIPVILFSANTGIDIIVKRTNANGVLKKPFDVNEMLAIIENALAGIK
ncbi:response regulator [Ginsengibacter hankyongi]|uniref:Response regulator n=1 Tax=Ginsengibacter hankyongi TaxID=2607284 RepID=A0A5J5IJZ2_9BACT|nr:response regulator [Ginsengibacter hankyongi]KAA9040858.1 response regulator [Ginsengibacter hankyongi]